jgi:hypothetical protein
MTTPKYPADCIRSCAVIEGEAAATRWRLGFDLEEPLPSLPLFERLGQLKTGPSFNIPVGYEIANLPDGVLGETSFSSEKGEIIVTLSPSTYEGLERNVPRDRYSAAHEAGHAVQHSAEVIRLSRLPHRADALLRGAYATLKRYEDAEWQANAFAAALLIPARALWILERKGCELTPELLQRYFGVSRSCAEKRLRTYADKWSELVR